MVRNPSSSTCPLSPVLYQRLPSSSTITSAVFSGRRGHNYISLFHDLDAGRVLFATEERKAEVVEQFADDLEAHGGCAENIQDVCIDMSKSFIAGVESTLPWAKITFDEFHIIQMANQVVDAVRREEVQTEPLL